MNGHLVLADAVALAHAGYVLFVVLGLVAILLGGWLRWDWVRNFWLRLVHLVAMVVVAIETLLGWTCPLTDLEDWLRTQGGQEAHQGSFVSRLAHGVLFWPLPEWVFDVLHVGMALIIVAAFACVPPRLPRRRRSKSVVHENPSLHSP